MCLCSRCPTPPHCVDGIWKHTDRLCQCSGEVCMFSYQLANGVIWIDHGHWYCYVEGPQCQICEAEYCSRYHQLQHHG